MHTTSPVIDCRRAEFADSAIESRFNRDRLPQRIRQITISLILCAAFYLAFAATDLTTLGTTTTAFLLLSARILVALLAVAGCILLRRDDATVTLAIAAVNTVEVVGMAVFMVLCWHQPHATAWNALSLGLMVVAIYVNIPNRLVYASAIAIGASIVFSVMVLVQRTLQTDDLVAMALLLLLANALGHIGARALHLAQREAFRAALALQELAGPDPLTGCGNRQVLEGVLEAEIVRARRYGTPLSVVLCDVDHLARINHAHGHAAGDQVLDDFASLLRAMARDAIDSAIRYDVDTFLLVLPETELDGAMQLAERIRNAAAATGATLANGRRIHVSASFGIAAVSGAHAHGTAADLLAVADAQLDAAKDAGRNCVRGVAWSAMAGRAVA